MEQKRINFDQEYVEMIKRGKKVTTIRRGIKRYPVGRLIELTVDNKPFAKAKVEKVVVKRVRELGYEDARLDGFESVDELMLALKKIYGNVREDEFVTVVHFTVVD